MFWLTPINEKDLPPEPPKIRFEPTEPRIVIDRYWIKGGTGGVRINHVSLTIAEAERLWGDLDRALTEAKRNQ